MERNQKLDRYFNWALGAFCVAGFILADTRLYISGRGMHYETKVTFGLLEWLGWKQATFYSIKPLYFSLFFTALGVGLVCLSKQLGKANKRLRFLYNANRLLVFLPTIILFFNYDATEWIEDRDRKYAQQFMPYLDELFQVDYQMYINLNPTPYTFFLYSLFLLLVSYLLLLALLYKNKYSQRADT